MSDTQRLPQSCQRVSSRARTARLRSTFFAMMRKRVENTRQACVPEHEKEALAVIRRTSHESSDEAAAIEVMNVKLRQSLNGDHTTEHKRQRSFG